MPIITIKGVPKSKKDDLDDLMKELQEAVASEPALGKGPKSVNVYFLEDFAKSDNDIAVEILLIEKDERTPEVLKSVANSVREVLEHWRIQNAAECSKIVLYFHLVKNEHLFIYHY